MRFVPAKTGEQQAAVLLHRGRERLVRQRTMLVNALRGHLAEFGVIAPQGLRNVGRLIAIIRDEEDARLPGLDEMPVFIERREFITLGSAAAMSSPLAARAAADDDGRFTRGRAADASFRMATMTIARNGSRSAPRLSPSGSCCTRCNSRHPF
jgi:transposase